MYCVEWWLLVWLMRGVVECGCWRKLVKVVIGKVKGKGSCECVLCGVVWLVWVGVVG